MGLPGGVRVWPIDALHWETTAAVDPVGTPWSLDAWLASLPGAGLTRKILPVSLIADGPCGGGHVLLAESWGDRLYFAVPPNGAPHWDRGHALLRAAESSARPHPRRHRLELPAPRRMVCRGTH